MAVSKKSPPPLTVEQLQQYYREINRTFFGSVLPETIPITLRASQTFSARAHAEILRDPNAPRWDKRRGAKLIWSSLGIEMNTSDVVTEDRFRAIFLHEMIHIYFYVIGDFEEEHGSKFMEMRKKLSDKTGLDIPVTEKRSVKDANFHATEMGVILITRSNGNKVIAILTAKTVRENLDAIFERMMSFKEKDVKVYVTNSRPIVELSAVIKTQRSYSGKTKYYHLKNEAIVQDLEENATLLRSL